MPKTPAQRQAALRERKKERGLSEVRGIWAEPDQHKVIRDRVKLLVSVKERK